MTRHPASTRPDFYVTKLRNSRLLRALCALNSNRVNTGCSAQTYSEVPLLLFRAQAFGVSQSRALLERGRTQRNKLVRIVQPACAPPWFAEFGGHWQAG